MIVKRKALIIFLLIITVLTGCTLAFIQSEQFARIIKATAVNYFPKNLGIIGDFSDLRVNIFPPGLTISKPTVSFKEENVANLPRDSTVRAEQIILKFYPLQMLTGNIRVHEVVILKGDVKLELSPEFLKAKKTNTEKSEVSWDELLKVRAESVVFEDTKVQIDWKTKGNPSSQFLAQKLSVEQWSGKGGVGYKLDVNVTEIQGQVPKHWKIPPNLKHFRARVKVNSIGAHIGEISGIFPGLSVSLIGQLDGNVLDPKELALISNFNIRGDLAEIIKVLEIKAPSNLSGEIAFTGVLSGDLAKASSKLQAEGVLTGQNLHYEKWQADLISLEGKWRLLSGVNNSEITVRQAIITAKELPRMPPNQKGHGGTIKVGGFSFRTQNPGKIVVPLELDNVHLHWLAAPAIDSIYALDFRTIGTVDLEYIPKQPAEPEPWKVLANLNLKVPHFQLDNQGLGKRKQLNKVLSIADLNLEGIVQIDDKAVRPRGLKVFKELTSFEVGGKIDYETGWHLKAFGKINGEEIGSIAETPLRGLGSLKTHVHGKPENVFIDFDVDMKDARYLALRLGHLQGRITYEDAKGLLHFRKMEISKGETSYGAHGRIDLLKDEIPKLRFKFKGGDIQDVSDIFQDFTKKLWWFPHTLTGKTKGVIEVFGKLDLDKLSVLGRFTGSDWSFHGERFRKVSLIGGFVNRRYFVENLILEKRIGQIQGDISFEEKTEKIQWQVAGRKLTVRQLDNIARLDVPLKGKIQFKSSGKGMMGNIDSNTDLVIDELEVRGKALPPSSLSIISRGSILEAKGTGSGSQAIFDAKYDFTPKKKSHIKLELVEFDYTPVLLFLNPKLISDHSLQGYVSGRVHLNFTSQQAEFSNGEIALKEFVLAKSGTNFKLQQKVNSQIKNGTFDVDQLIIEGNRGSANVTLHSRQAQISGSVLGKIDLSIVEFVTSSIARAEGQVNLNMKLGGTIKNPIVRGRAELKKGEVAIEGLDAPIENISSIWDLDQNVIRVRDTEGDLGNGRVTAQGKIQLFAHTYPTLNLKGNLINSKLAFFPFQYAKTRGKINVHGSSIPYLVDGDVWVSSALSTEPVLKDRSGGVRRALRYTPRATGIQESDFPMFKLKVRVRADRGILIKNDLFDAELKGNIILLNTIAVPRITGSADVIKGKMRFKDREFDIRSAKLTFDNPTVIDPKFNLFAFTEVNNVKVQLFASGSVSKTKVELNSDPVMPESEIISLLAMGFTSEDLQRMRAGDQSLLQQGEAASLLLHSFDFNRDIRKRTGFQLELDEAVDTKTGTSKFRPTETESSGANAAPKIVIKRRIGKKVDVSVGSTVGVGTKSEREAKAEVKVTPGISVIGVWSSFEGVGTAEDETQNSIGVDLKLQKRFK